MLVSDVEPGADRQTWKTRLAALEGELASQPPESLSDALRLGEKMLAAVGLDVRAGTESLPGAADDVSEISARLVRASELVAAAGTAWRSGGTAHSSQKRMAAQRTRWSTGRSRCTRIAERITRSVASGRVTILNVQGTYYVVSGLWAVVDRQGFERASGRKTDYWLVRTVGLLAAAIGLNLLMGARGGRPSSETRVLGVAAGASFTAIDLAYVARRRISPIYLGDAAVHGLLAGCALIRSLEPSRKSS
jgi:hypothetical protein